MEAGVLEEGVMEECRLEDGVLEACVLEACVGGGGGDDLEKGGQMRNFFAEWP